MKIGYLRVSTEEQCFDRQIDELEGVCDKIHIERISAVAKKRPVFEGILKNLQRGDTLVVWDLDRAFRSTVDAITEAEKMRERGIEFQILTLKIDTNTADGKLVYTVIAAMAEHERSRLSERTKQGLAAARKRGSRLGQPPKLSDAQIRDAKHKIETGKASIAQMASYYGVHYSTIARSIKRILKS